VLTEYRDAELPLVLEALERLEAHLTAAVVSNDPIFTQKARRTLHPSSTPPPPKGSTRRCGPARCAPCEPQPRSARLPHAAKCIKPAAWECGRSPGRLKHRTLHT